jgi:predicted O-methyltransferase YrrM
MRSILRDPREAVSRLTDLLPPIVAAYGDWVRPGRHTTWGGPMNGQAARQHLVRSLAREFSPRLVVETGTYRGETTAFLADVTGAPTYSVEAVSRYHHYAVWRLSGRSEVRLYKGDSRLFLEGLGTDERLANRLALFYLDAHWSEDLPLAEELRTIAAKWPDAIVLIDDFQVPGDPGYGFDDYGPGRRLAEEILPSAIHSWIRLYPAAPSQAETGARRGCVVLATPGFDSNRLRHCGLRP